MHQVSRRVAALLLATSTLGAWGGAPGPVAADRPTATTAGRSAPQAPASSREEAPRQRALAAIARLPLDFEKNVGQATSPVDYVARGAGYAVALSASGATITLSERPATPAGGAPDIASVQFVLRDASRLAQPSPEDRRPGTVNYFLGNDPARWHAGLATFARVRYAQVYRGIDVVYHGNQRRLQYDFVIAPGADPAQIAFDIHGADRTAIDANGRLVLTTGARTIEQDRPFTYQVTAGGERQEVASRFVLDGSTVRFAVGDYDRSRELVIDPTLSYSTWFGGLSDEGILDVQIDGNGNIVIAGYSTAAQGFPTTAGALRMVRTGVGAPSDAFVAKLNPAGSALIFSTLLGGDGAENDLPQALNGGLGIDAAGNIHVTGLTHSANFPTTVGAHDETFNGGAFAVSDGYYTKLSPTGTLDYSTYFGGTGEEVPSALAVDASNNVYIVGQTTSSGAAGFSTPNGLRTTIGSARDAFLVKFNAAGNLTYGTFFGGSNATIGHDVAVIATNRVVVVGATPGGATFPITAGALQTSFAGGSGPGDAFLVTIDTSVAGAGGLLYGTFYGGTSDDAFNAVSVDGSGKIYAGGYTKSAGLVTAMAAGGAVPAGTRADALVAKFDTSLAGAAGKVYAIRIAAVDASLGDEQVNDIVVDALGRAWVVGLHNGSVLSLINPFDSTAANLRAFAAQIAADGASALLVSYAGGRNTNSPNLFGVALNAAGEVFMAGHAVEPTLNSASLPLVSPYQSIYGGGGADGTLQKYGFTADLSLTKVASPALPATVLPGQALTYTITVTNGSAEPASDVLVSDTLPGQVSFVSCAATGGGVCAGTGATRTVTFATLAGGASATITLATTVNNDVLPGTQWTNTATVGAQTFDPSLGNNAGGTTTGAPSLSDPSGDADGDGLPNGWEQKYGLNPLSNDPANGANGDPDGDGRTNAQEYADDTHPRGFVITFLAEGATGAFFDTRLAIANPSALPALVLTRFQKTDGTTVRDYRTVPAMSRTTIDVETLAGLEAAEFSTLVEADVQVVVDRTLSWDDRGYGSHAERGILTRTATEWYFAEGATHSGFSLFYLIQNPNTQPATVEVRYLRPPPAAALTKVYTVGAQSRFNIWVNNEAVIDPNLAGLAASDMSVVMRSTNGVPIIAERALYRDTPGQTFGIGHESAGVTAPALSWFLAEGATGPYFDMFVLLANPNPTDAAVTVQYLLTSGQTLTKTYTVSANSRSNIWVDLEEFPAGSGNRLLADAEVSTTVDSTNGIPIIVERAMYWPGPNFTDWREAHNSPGSTVTGTRWAVAEGEQGGPRSTETFVLVANTSTFAGQVRATVLFEDGTAPVSKDFAVPAKSRFNIAPGAEFPTTAGKRFGMVVESIGASPIQIVVERAMYSNAEGVVWAAGTNALATRLQ